MILGHYDRARKRVFNAGLPEAATVSLLGELNVKVRTSGNLLIVSDNFTGAGIHSGGGNDRGKISEFSAGSSKRLKEYLRTCESDYHTLLTLTYPAGEGYSGERAKRDLKVFVQRIRRNKGTVVNGLLPLSIFWFMEFQGRGSIHFHCFLNARIPKSEVSKMWYEVCGTDDARHLASGTKIEAFRAGRKGALSYAAKYAAKHEQKAPPKSFGWVGRFWGVFGCRSRVAAAMVFNSNLGGISGVSTRVKELSDFLVLCQEKGELRALVMEKQDSGCDVFVYQMSESIVTQVTMKVLFIAMHSYQDYNLWIPQIEPIEEIEEDDFDVN